MNLFPSVIKYYHYHHHFSLSIYPFLSPYPLVPLLPISPPPHIYFFVHECINRSLTFQFVVRLQLLQTAWPSGLNRSFATHCTHKVVTLSISVIFALILRWEEHGKTLREVFHWSSPVACCAFHFKGPRCTHSQALLYDRQTLRSPSDSVLCWAGISFFTFTSPLTAGVVGAPEMTSQPVSSIFSPVLHYPLWELANSRPVHCLMLSSHLFFFLSVCLVFLPLSLCLARWFWGQTWWTGDMSI